MCGLIGIPPSNGVIPQSPMHTKSLATLKYQVIYPEISLKLKVLSIKRLVLKKLFFVIQIIISSLVVSVITLCTKSAYGKYYAVASK